jgi:hypothetical protein
MNNIFLSSNSKQLLMVNLVAVAVLFFCEIFVVSIFIQKGMAPDVVRWKYLAYLIGMIVVSIFFIVSIISMLFFLKMKNKQPKGK